MNSSQVFKSLGFNQLEIMNINGEWYFPAMEVARIIEDKNANKSIKDHYKIFEEEQIPKVFISYCWSSDQHIDWVRSLAEKLVAESGVEVILDQWHGEIGHDRFHFMEESIKIADKVLVICDKKYCDKANERAGGVGTEIRIITPEIYRNNKQDKFIPIALELNEHNEYLLPEFMSSRFALGMLNEEEFEKSYKKLERLVWRVPLLKPPVRGEKPDFESEIKGIITPTITRPLLDKFD